MQIVRVCNEMNVPFLPRGAGTSLAGGCLPVGGGVLISLSRMKRILEVDYRNRFAVVEPGVVNLWLTNHLKPHGWHFAPDPSSQGACTIGGNVATNSGGPHTLKYGVTVNHVLGVEMVLPDGRVVQTGGPAEDNPGYDLTGVIVGSEGTFGVVTKIWVRITRNPEAYRTLLGVFETVDDATNTISDLIGAGIVPAALEMLDRLILQAVEAAFHFGFPLDAGAVLIMEVDGLEAGLDADAERITEVAMKNRRARCARPTPRRSGCCCGSRASRRSGPSAGWRRATARRTASCRAPNCPHILRLIQGVGEKYDLRICNVFHAGDGNIHPILLFDERDADQVRRVLAASHEILDECIRLGGSVTGEHGIGVEKINFMPKLFTPEDLGMMLRLRSAFNPEGRCSPRKMLPTAGACIEPTKAGRRAAL